MAAEGQFPQLWQAVLDSTDPRGLAEFYRALLGFEYRPGDDAAGSDAEWLVLQDSEARTRVAFQRATEVARSTWPDPAVPQQLHLDLRVETVADLDLQHERVLRLGAELLLDRSDDPEEQVRVYADPAGHPFCIFVRALGGG